MDPMSSVTTAKTKGEPQWSIFLIQAEVEVLLLLLEKQALPLALLWLGRSDLQEIIVMGSVMSSYQSTGRPHHVLFVFMQDSSL